MIISNVVSRTLSSSITRIPSIRFRYGASRDQKSAPASGGPLTAQHQARVKPNEPIYDFQIPPRWRRRPISEEEIAYINRGGPE